MYGASSTVVASSGTSQARHSSSNWEPNHVHASGASGPSPWTMCLAPLRSGGDGTRQLADRVHDDVGLPVDRPGDQELGAAEGRRPEDGRRRPSGSGARARSRRGHQPFRETRRRPRPGWARRSTSADHAGPLRRRPLPGRHDDLVAGPVGGLGEGKHRQQVTVSRVRREEDAHGSTGPRSAIGVMQTTWSSDGERIGPRELRHASTQSSSRPIDVGTGGVGEGGLDVGHGAVGAAGRVVDQHEASRLDLGRQRDRVGDRGVPVGVCGRPLADRGTDRRGAGRRRRGPARRRPPGVPGWPAAGSGRAGRRWNRRAPRPGSRTCARPCARSPPR